MVPALALAVLLAAQERSDLRVDVDLVTVAVIEALLFPAAAVAAIREAAASNHCS